jgi:hypothetical protein
MGFGSRARAARAAKTPQFFTMLVAASQGRIVTNPGGWPQGRSRPGRELTGDADDFGLEAFDHTCYQES